MTTTALFRLAIVLAGLARAIALYAAAPQPELLAAWRNGTEAALLDAAGRIHFYGATGVVRTLPLTSKGKPVAWRHEPTSFVRINSDWIVADGTPQLRRFNAAGELIDSLNAPAPLSDLTIAGKTVWGANRLAGTASKLLWSTTSEAKAFKSFPLKDDPHIDGVAAMYRSQVIIAGSSTGELFLAHLIDAPVVHRVFPPQRAASWPLAYSRSRARDGLSRFEPGLDNPSLYSTPVRDILAAPGALSVLRNREDVKLPSGRTETQQGIRADRYDNAGRHIASAVFAEPVKWLLFSDGKGVVAATGRGAVRTAQWGKPLPGGIVR